MPQQKKKKKKANKRISQNWTYSKMWNRNSSRLTGHVTFCRPFSWNAWNPLDPVGQTSITIDPLWMFTFKWAIRILKEVVSHRLIMATATVRSMRGMISSQCRDCVHCMLSVCPNPTTMHTQDWPETNTVHVSWQNQWWTSEFPREKLPYSQIVISEHTSTISCMRLFMQLIVYSSLNEIEADKTCRLSRQIMLWHMRETFLKQSRRPRGSPLFELKPV